MPEMYGLQPVMPVVHQVIFNGMIHVRIDEQWAEFLGNYVDNEVDKNVDLNDLESDEGEEDMDENFDELVVEENGISFNYRVTAATARGKNFFPRERYLCLGWYEYFKATRLRVGDVLECTVTDPPTRMFVRFMM
ncbi:hypothetical protein RYX36_031634 [Vicia faba]